MNDNKTIKVLRILTLTISLMLLVFALAKKVGLCASGDNNTSSVSSLPFPVGAGFGNTFTQSELQSIMQIIEDDQANSNDSDYVGKTIGVVYLYEFGSDYIRLRVMTAPDCILITDSSDAFTSSGASVTYKWGSMSYAGVREVILNTSDLSYSDGWWTRGNYGYNTSDWTEELPNNSRVLKSGNLTGYPIYVYQDIMSGNDVFFSMNTHSIGGGLTDYSDEVQNFIDSNVNNVDVTDPSNTSNVPSWLQKILSGLGTINNTIGGGFSWIKNGINNIFGAISDFSDTVVDGFSSIVGKLDDVITSIEGNSGDYETVSDAWIDCYEDSLIYDFISEFSVVDASLKSLVNTSAASSVSFSIGLPSWNVPNVSGSGSSNILANHNSLSFNFDWYTVPRYSNGDSIRDRIWIVFIPFILVGFMWRLLAKIPSILGGNSGLSEGVHKTIEVSSIYANRTN